ncbi:MAG: type IV toxin-antitoxin system AbiEi family antitoxin domain-containing protein [Acidimicrobiia bacterium]
MSKTLRTLDFLARERRVFTAAEFREHYGGSPTNAANALKRAIRDGMIERVAHGSYAIREVGRLSTDSSTEDVLLALASVLGGRDHRIAYLTALELHSLLLYPPTEVQVALTSPTRTTHVSGRSFRQVIEVPRYLKVGASQTTHGCLVSDLPRALLDAARRPDLIGGVDTIVNALQLAGQVDTHTIVEYADKLDSHPALRRLGSMSVAAGRYDIASVIRSNTTLPVTPIAIDPSSPSEDVTWLDPAWNVAWDSMSADLIGMRANS